MRPAPFAHQVADTQTVIREPFHFLGLDPGLGKSRVIVDAACELFLEREIDTLIVVAPAAVRSVWADPSPVLGEWVKWVHAGVEFDLTEYTAKTVLRNLSQQLSILVTNPEFIRREEHLERLRTWARARQTMLVADESWQFKNPRAAQTKALYKLRTACKRVYLLNGTPGEPKDLFAQYQILSPTILDCKNWWQFRGRYCVLGGFQGKSVVSYQKLEDFHRRTAPFTTIRKDRECLDLGPEPVRTQIEAVLTEKTWRLYVDMRDDMIAWLSSKEAAVAGAAGTKAMRLAQMVNGFVGGVEVSDADLLDERDDDETTALPTTIREVGREKLDALLAYLDELRTEAHQGAAFGPHGRKALIFTRFRADVDRTTIAMGLQYPLCEVRRIYGAQNTREGKLERHQAKELLAPGGDPRSAIVVANAASGGAGLTLSAASLGVFLANDYSLKTRIQAEKRLDRPGQTRRVTFLDVIAVGPKGQPTIDRTIVESLRRKEDLAAWTPEQWRQALLAASG